MSSKEIFTWDKRSNNLSECKGCQRIACNLFLIQPHENTCTCTFVIKNGMVNVAKMKRAFYSCYLVPKYNFTTELSVSSFILLSKDLIQYWARSYMWYVQKWYLSIKGKKASLGYHGNSLPSIPISSKES